MTISYTFRTVIFAALLVSIPLVASARCGPPHYVAGRQAFKFSTDKSATGAMVDNFVDVQRADGSLYSVRQGVDLSHWNDDISYEALKSCGTEFVILKLDKIDLNFRARLTQLSALRVPYAPYFWFTVGSELRQSNQYTSGRGDPTSLTRDRIFTQGLMANAETAARVQFVAFHDSMNQLGGIHVTGSARFELEETGEKLVLVDVEEGVIGKQTDVAQKTYGSVYGHAIRTWIEQVRKSYPDYLVMLYTSPYVWGTLLQYSYVDDRAVLDGVPVWISRYHPSAGDVYQGHSDSPLSAQLVQRLCEPGNGIRCVLHQYTAAGSVAASKYHVDLDRLFRVKKIRNNAGEPVYVRSDAR